MSEWTRRYRAEIIAACLVLLCDLLINIWSNEFSGNSVRDSYGWPSNFYEIRFSGISLFNVFSLFENFGFAILLAAGAGILVHALKRTNGGVLRFHLHSGIAFVGVLGILLGINILLKYDNGDNVALYGWPEYAVAFRYKPSRFAFILNPEEWKPHYFVIYRNVTINILTALYIGLATVVLCEMIAAFFSSRHRATHPENST